MEYYQQWHYVEVPVIYASRKWITCRIEYLERKVSHRTGQLWVCRTSI